MGGFFFQYRASKSNYYGKEKGCFYDEDMC